MWKSGKWLVFCQRQQMLRRQPVSFKAVPREGLAAGQPDVGHLPEILPLADVGEMPMFSQEMQMTFVEYVTRKRMEKAKALLLETEMRSHEVALAVGYKNPHYFSFVFKKTQNCTPREYRTGKEKI